MKDGLKNFGMLIPREVIRVKKPKMIFGYAILWAGKWVGIGKYIRDVPVRRDEIINFLFWRFVKPIDRPGIRTWTFIQKK